MLNKIIEDLQEQWENDPCWKKPGNEMRSWAETCEARGLKHGMGNLQQPCDNPPGFECPACGKKF